MATAPFGVRLLVGAAVTVVDETRKLPQTILTYPMTLASQLAQTVMKMQQDVADLVNRGDEVLENLFPPRDEKPQWATFDEDTGDELPEPGGRGDGERLTEGRFALYSVNEDSVNGEAGPPAAGAPVTTAKKTATVTPPIVADLGYDDLTLAQLRARLPSLGVPELEALLAYEEAGKARAPFQTLLANRITRATAK
jgi:hypothetical protein